LTPRQFTKHISVYKKKQRERVSEVDTLNHALGQYIGIAINDPKKYPKKPYSNEQKIDTLKPMSDEQMERFAKRFTNKLNKQNNG
jgi:hypothetical protein